MILLVGLCLLSACAPGAEQDRSDTDARPTPTESPLLAGQWLGVVTRSVGDRSTARQLGLPGVIRGAFIDRVIPGMPATEAGLKPGDVITEIRVGRGAEEIGYSVDSFGGLEPVLRELHDLKRLTVEVFRGPAPLNRSSYATRLFRVRLERN